MGKVVIIHGTKGEPQGSWFPWLAIQLAQRGDPVIVPRMPTPEGQSLESWFAAFHEQVGAIDSSTTIIGHSTGAVFLLRLLEQINEPIETSIFVAGFTAALGSAEYDPLNATFVADEYDWDKIRKNAGDVVCLSGDSDPYVPQTQALDLARNLGVEACLVPDGGHLNAEFGYTEFPLLLEILDDIRRSYEADD